MMVSLIHVYDLNIPNSFVSETFVCVKYMVRYPVREKAFMLEDEYQLYQLTQDHIGISVLMVSSLVNTGIISFVFRILSPA